MTADQEADAIANGAIRTFYVMSKGQQYFRKHGEAATDVMRSAWLKEAQEQWPLNGGHPYTEE